MNLFLNAVSWNWIIILFDNNRQIIDKESISILLQESAKLIDIVDNFLLKNNFKYKDINNIVVVNWPWSFTWIRTISLVVNTLAYIFENIRLTPISFFDLFKNYPIIKTSSKRDLFVKKSESSIIYVVSNEDFIDYLHINKIKEVYWEKFDLCEVNSNINYAEIISNLKLDDKKQIEAYYVKKPNIS